MGGGFVMILEWKEGRTYRDYSLKIKVGQKRSIQSVIKTEYTYYKYP